MATPNVEDDTITYISRVPFILLMVIIMMIGTVFLGWSD